MKAFTHWRTIFGLDLRSLALFRIGLGLIILLDLINRAHDLSIFYTDQGVTPRAVYLEKFVNKLHWSLHFANGEAWFQGLLFVIAGLFALALMVGYRTKFVTIVSWILLVSLQNRNYMVLNGGDVLFRLLLFWGMFLPLGVRFSIDAALSSTKPAPETNRFLGVASVALLAQVAFLYWFTAALKTGDEWLWEGTATYYALSIDQFTTPLGKWMLQFPTFLQYSTYGVWFWEALGPFLFISPILFAWSRYVAIVGFCMMHFTFGSMMEIGLFPLIDAVSLIVMLPPHFWERMAAWWRTEERLKLTIYYDEECGFCRRMALLIRQFFLLHDTKIEPGQAHPEVHKIMVCENSWVVEDAAGIRHVRMGGVATVLEHQPVFGPLVRRLPVRAFLNFIDGLYVRVAKRRSVLGPLFAQWLRERDLPEFQLRPVSQLTAMFCLWYVAMWNIQTLQNPPFVIVKPYKQVYDKIGPVLRLDQKWSMFSPYPMKDDGWYVIPGKLGDGTDVDVYNFKVERVSYDKPELVSATYPNQRWRKYMMNVWKKSHKDHRLYLGKWLCKTWNKDRLGTNRLESFNIIFMKELTTLDGEEEPRQVNIWKHRCYTESGTSKISH